MTKHCPSCEQDLPITQFYRKGAGRYQNVCKGCQHAYMRAWRRKSAMPAFPSWLTGRAPASISGRVVRNLDE